MIEPIIPAYARAYRAWCELQPLDDAAAMTLGKLPRFDDPAHVLLDRAWGEAIRDACGAVRDLCAVAGIAYSGDLTMDLYESARVALEIHIA